MKKPKSPSTDKRREVLAKVQKAIARQPSKCSNCGTYYDPAKVHNSELGLCPDCEQKYEKETA